MEALGYVVAAAIVVFGVFVVRHLIRSWRSAYGGGRDHTGTRSD